jgi:hypothetical protein
MYYKCLRCGNEKELRKGKRTGNNRAQYLDLETEMQESKVLQLKKTSGTRRLCPPCLGEILVWLGDKKVHVKRA